MIDINRVYERVLFLANKEQRGYITPDEFNSFADQAQLEIFKGYLGKKLVIAQSGLNSSDEYGDADKIIEERLTFFDNTITPTKGMLANNTPGIQYPDNFWSLGMIHVHSRTIGNDTLPVMADEVSHRDLAYINLSPLTAPTSKQPVYTRHEDGIVLYPSNLNSTDDTTVVSMVYLRRPVQPVWAHLADPTGQPIYNATLSTDFELNAAEEDELVYRILTLSGVTIKQPDLVQFGKQNEE